MDKTDSTILSILKENSRASASDISKQVSLSVPAVTERIRKLEQTGVIEKYTIRVNPGASGYNPVSYTHLCCRTPAALPPEWRSSCNGFRFPEDAHSPHEAGALWYGIHQHSLPDACLLYTAL